MDFDRLPDLLFEEIFSNLTPLDIIDSTLVSKRFNEVISNSFKLMNQINVYWDSERDQQNRLSTRKYRSVIWHMDIVSLNFIDFIAINSRSLTSITIDNWDANVPSSLLQKILTLVADKLNDFNFATTFHVNSEIHPIAFKKLKCLSLDLIGDPSIIAFFHGGTIEEFNYTEIGITRVEIDSFTDFFESQPKLKKIFLNGASFMRTSLDRGMFSNSTFQLQSLQILNERNEFNGPCKVNFRKLLTNQLTWLETLELFNLTVPFEMMKTFMRSKLTTLKISLCDLVWNRELDIINNLIHTIHIGHMNDSIQDLNFILSDLFKSCPMIQRIDLKSISVSMHLSLLMAHEMTNLRYLSIVSCSMSHFVFPSLAELQLDHVRDDSFIILMVLVNTHLPVIKVRKRFENDIAFQRAIQTAKVQNVIYQIFFP